MPARESHELGHSLGEDTEALVFGIYLDVVLTIKVKQVKGQMSASNQQKW